MVIILLSWLYITFIAYVYGHALIAFLSHILKQKARVHFTIYVISGFALLTALSSYLSLVIKIGLAANAMLLLFALIYLWLRASNLIKAWQSYWAVIKQASFFDYLIFSLSLGMALIISAIPKERYDDGLYYQQTIKWIESYPAIAGLGNIHLKLSFNSGWHVLSALFSFSSWDLYLNDLNGLLFVLVSILALDGLRAIKQHRYRFSDVFKVFAMAPLHLLFAFMYAPSPDMVIPYLVWVIFVLFLQKAENQALARFDLSSLLILLLSVFAVVIKLSAAPIAILSLYLLVTQLRHRNYQVLWPVLGITAFMLVPWFLRNIIISGYLVYPFYQLDLFAVDWKIPAALIQLEVLETKSFAKIKGMLFSEVDQLSVAEWLPYWYNQLITSEKVIVLINCLLTLLLPGLMYYRWKGKKLSQEDQGLCLLVLTVYAGIVFWFFTAPHFRYGMAFILAIYLLVFAYFLYLLSRKITFAATWVFPLLLLLFYAKPVYDTLKRYKIYKQEDHFLVYPGKVLYTPAKPVDYNGISIYVPEENAQCWGSPLPCAPFVVDGLEMRTGKLTDGFRVIQPNPQLYSQKRLESMKENGLKYNFLKIRSVQ